MKGYSSNIPENCALARVEGVNASYKDLSEVCGRIRGKKTDWAVSFLERAAEGEIPVLYKRHNKKLGHRRELGGQKGRYPKKAAGIVLKALQSAMANGKVKGLGDGFTIHAANANKKDVFPRMAPKGRTARSFLVTCRIEIILQGKAVPKGVSVTPPKKEEKTEAKKAASAKEETPVVGKEEKREPPKLQEAEGHKHKHEAEKLLDSEKRREEKPHQHAENDKR
ncbi:MAG: 50S ribosomal protein L22 [Candidatus Micrarchaeota archaeon]